MCSKVGTLDCYFPCQRYYRPQRSCGQGNIFTPVCHSFCSQGGVLPQWMLGYHLPPEQTPPRSRQPPGKQTPAYGLRAAGTHPTGMHSCERNYFAPYKLYDMKFIKISCRRLLSFSTNLHGTVFNCTKISCNHENGETAVENVIEFEDG